jgi:hypothetical protein
MKRQSQTTTYRRATKSAELQTLFKRKQELERRDRYDEDALLLYRQILQRLLELL